MKLSRQAEPMYLELAETLRDELVSYRTGDYLPAEFQLAERFCVNRHTIRRAVDELVREGSVLRRQGKGTQVLERPLIYPMQADSACRHKASAWKRFCCCAANASPVTKMRCIWGWPSMRR
ncbi:hypothetical protein ALQ86_102781 [Pseudomonas amygdali pv. eriobotryae]|uniref:HTH gntR-type domain-containing protein n=1 Tax=Pseudomonas amygdali pv. eriobotryae TaxID=129137 RepID=A0A3M3AT14_PSEA0|nr:hypothetical protein ALQ86_102781 [Pseudomonas amygdali pv. eriobotryae]